MTGFQGLVNSKFGGNEHVARQWVADLGRAYYFYDTKPGLAISYLAPYKSLFPHLFIMDGGMIVDIAWPCRRRARSAGDPLITSPGAR